MKQIELTQGQIALVDDIDYDYLMQWKWCARLDRKNNSYYSIRGTYLSPHKTKTLYMHRIIVEQMLGRKLECPEQVDHLKGNTLDNRRSELSIKTSTENQINRGKTKANTSGYKGINFLKGTQRYDAAIKVLMKRKHLGTFSGNEEGKIEAAKMYDRAYLYFFGDMATERGMNFPGLKEQYLDDLVYNKYKWMK